MTATKDTSTQNAANRRRGKTAEVKVANYLREQGWPHAERARRTGFRVPGREVADPGDIAGCPGIIWSVKDTQVERLPEWLAELDAMGEPGDQVGGLRLLVVKRRQKGSPAEWWCWVTVDQLHWLLAWNTCPSPISDELVRIRLGGLVPLLHRAGYAQEVAS